MYAQAIEGDTWKGEKMDKAKIDKMSGVCMCDKKSCAMLTMCRPANRSDVRAYAKHTEAERRRRRGRGSRSCGTTR